MHKISHSNAVRQNLHKTVVMWNEFATLEGPTQPCNEEGKPVEQETCRMAKTQSPLNITCHVR